MKSRFDEKNNALTDLAMLVKTRQKTPAAGCGTKKSTIFGSLKTLATAAEAHFFAAGASICLRHGIAPAKKPSRRKT
jgi:hypothetical protein